MGFCSGAYATVWSVESKSPTVTTGRVSISKKNKETGAYEDEYSGYIGFIGTNCAAKALRLRERDRIRLGNVDCRKLWDKGKQREYRNDQVFSFYVEGEPEFTAKRAKSIFDVEGSSSQGGSAPSQALETMEVDDGELTEEDLPF